MKELKKEKVQEGIEQSKSYEFLICLVSQQTGNRKYTYGVSKVLVEQIYDKFLDELVAKKNIVIIAATDGKEVIIDYETGDRLFVCIERLDYRNSHYTS